MDSQFDTPHNGRANKLKILLISFLVIACVVFNVWYYVRIFNKQTVVPAPQNIVRPPTPAERSLIKENLSNRISTVTDKSKADMIKSIDSKKEVVGVKDRQASISSLIK